MWGHYANAHKGICLQFTPSKNEQNNIAILDVTDKSYQLHKVRYDKRFPVSNFFENINGLSEENLIKNWLTKNENFSALAKGYKTAKQIQARLKKSFLKHNSFKHHDWKYEKELRLILSPSPPYGELQMHERIIHYNLSQLTGIIFGINTDGNDIHKIHEIMRQKPKNPNFKWYRTHFSPYSDTLQIREFKMNS